MIDVILLVVTLSIPGHTTRVVNAEWPFFRTMADCRRVVVAMHDTPPIAERIECERRVLDTNTGKVVR
jgi:hypothetical protein